MVTVRTQERQTFRSENQFSEQKIGHLNSERSEGSLLRQFIHICLKFLLSLHYFLMLKTNIITDFIFDLIFPKYCCICDLEETYLCSACFNKLIRLEKQKCIACLKPSPFGKTHADCGSKNLLDGVVSAFPYKNPGVKKLIQLFKYKFIKDLYLGLAKLLSLELENNELVGHFQKFTIIPVPLHKLRINWRGFNQSELLSLELAKQIITPLDVNLVQRIKNTKPQVNLKKDDRKENIKNAFQVNGKALGNYLIIDDVITTGSTLNEIARVLKKAGANQVWAATIAAD